MGPSLSGRNFVNIPGGSVTEVTVNREVKTHDGPMRGGFSTSIEAVDDFIPNTHALATLPHIKEQDECENSYQS